MLDLALLQPALRYLDDFTMPFTRAVKTILMTPCFRVKKISKNTDWRYPKKTVRPMKRKHRIVISCNGVKLFQMIGPLS